MTERKFMTRKLSYKQTEAFEKHNLEQKTKRENRRNKICKNCKIIFFDTSKKITRRTCSKKCTYEFGSKIRFKNGTYKRTEEQINKTKITHAKLRAEGQMTIAPEKIQQMSNNMKMLWANVTEKTAPQLNGQTVIKSILLVMKEYCLAHPKMHLNFLSIL